MTGPRATCPVVGSPTGRWSARADSASTYASATPLWTRCRPAAIQTCPWWANDPQAPTDEAASTSTSSRTMSTELPPSSRWTRFRCCAANAPTALPALVDPVNAITRTARSTTRASPTSAPPGRTCSSPSGSPASAKICASTAPPLTAVRGSGFSRTALPSARAGATARIDRIVGTLKGAITPTTPTGTRRAMLSRGSEERSSSPYGADARAAASKHSCAEVAIWKPANGPMAPVSRMSHPVISSMFANQRSPARRRTAARSVCGRAAHSRWAPCARAAALATSAGVARPLTASCSPVEGETTA